MAILTFQLNQNLFLRDPQHTALGQSMITKSIDLIDTLGFEQFTFKKLADDIGSTEASVYRYFENKHRLLLYLIDWYWTWIEHRIDFETNNVPSPVDRLKRCLLVIAGNAKGDSDSVMKTFQLQRIVTTEFEKTYLTKQVDNDNKEGLFLPYKAVCKKIAAIVQEINPKYRFAHSLVSTSLLATTHQLYYAKHLPSLSDIAYDEKKHHKVLYTFLEELILNTITAAQR